MSRHTSRHAHAHGSRYASHYYENSPYGLSPQELMVIEALAEHGEPQTVLAKRLGYKSVAGVNGHLWNIYWKMEVHTAAEAAVKWIREQEIPYLCPPQSKT